MSNFYRMDVIAPALHEGAMAIRPRSGSYEKLADKLMGEMNSRTFDAQAFAYLLTSYPEQIQPELFKLVIALLNSWAAKYNNGTTRTDEEYNLASSAMFVIDQIIIRQGNP